MRPYRILACSVALFLPTAFASKKEVEAASMIKRATQLSHIRAEGSPPFRLKLDFKLTKEDGTVLEGTYLEIWASKAQWRRETLVGDQRRIEVDVGQQRWLLESSQKLPEDVRNLPALTMAGRFDAWSPDKIENRRLNDENLRCIESVLEPLPIWHIGGQRESSRRNGRPSLCFDANTGLLTAEIDPNEGTSCYFADYEKFGEHPVARLYRCAGVRHVTLEGRVVELTPVPIPDPSSFLLAGGEKERVACPDPILAPRAVYQPQPVSPGSGGGMAVITLNVGTDGIPRDLVVQSSPNSKLEKSALEAVQQWRFKPASCDGEPVSSQIAVEVDVHIQ